MSSREIAELTGKIHKNVKRDIAAMLKDLQIDALSFEHIYQDTQNREQTEYLLDREHTDCLLTGYSAPLRMKVIRRWQELEQAQAAPALPSTLPEALRLAADLAEQCTHLQLVVTDQAPKVAALARIAVASGSMCLTDAAKHLGVQRGALIDWMRANRWVYRRSGSDRLVAFQPRLDAGLLDHKVTLLGVDEEGARRLASQVRITSKGLAVLAQKIGRAQ
ncbi:MAG: phage regulatory protein/antirepressor Ant [Gammaproteobacteria bacterium]|uniref:Putative antirepressor protein n=1 Tax=viral metagenome TaxID=1070528 RepID=A0A6M3XE49_9ZZZZ|nr:phage regulatory protein/antirepressor Ant [Gammaproteobacteria bacterium]MBU2157156.1 phage regulatory protein/antirepressor Ant [Gammaproteobacteria bacterium]MBU2256070.1 phage regulatory protein/antirepressor Ant [Gammaproteobacteria bacterium]MBU2295138.1 phage regulatory protein/antirepressor Ant [Gammaproteobacteria bacterium]